MVPVQRCTHSRWASFYPVDWVMTAEPSHNSKLEMAISLPLLIFEVHIPAI
jgi:hypothetical protein